MAWCHAKRTRSEGFCTSCAFSCLLNAFRCPMYLSTRMGVRSVRNRRTESSVFKCFGGLAHLYWSHHNWFHMPFGREFESPHLHCLKPNSDPSSVTSSLDAQFHPVLKSKSLLVRPNPRTATPPVPTHWAGGGKNTSTVRRPTCRVPLSPSTWRGARSCRPRANGYTLQR